MDCFRLWLEKERKDILEHNQSRLTACCGKTGTGKSYSTIAYARSLMGETFDVRKHIAYFDPYDFLKAVNRAEKGSFIIFDDAGVGVDSRDWQKESNKMMTKIGQVFRTKNLYITFTTPDFSFVDIKYRKIFHYFVTMRNIDYKNQMTVAKWYQIDLDPWTGDFFRKNIEIRVGNRMEELDVVRAEKIPDDVAKEYEECRAKATDGLFKRAEELAEGFGGKSVTVDQAAQLLNMSAKDLWNAAARGWVGVVRDASTVKIPFKWVRDVADFLNLSRKDLTLIRGKDEPIVPPVGFDFTKAYPLTDDKFITVLRGEERDKLFEKI